MTKPRPGTTLTDIERWIALLGDAVDALEAFQAPHPYPGLESIADTVRFVRDAMARSQAARLDALKEFVRNHPPEF